MGVKYRGTGREQMGLCGSVEQSFLHVPCSPWILHVHMHMGVYVCVYLRICIHNI